MYPKSYAPRLDSRASPMLVGEVRCARPLGGSSWKLSGGRWLSAGPTNVSKYRHVRRATTRRKAWSSGDSRGRAARRGRLIHQATAGETSHSDATGSTTAPGRPEENSARAVPAASAAAGAAHID